MAPPSFPYGNRCRVRRSRAAPSPLRKPKNKIAAQVATFLRLGIVAWPPIADRSTKAQEISRKNEPFPLFGDRKESLIEKKLQRSQDFCFLTRKIAATGRSGRWRAGRMVACGTDERGETRDGACGTDATTYAVRGVQNGNAMAKFHYYVRSGR